MGIYQKTLGPVNFGSELLNREMVNHCLSIEGLFMKSIANLILCFCLTTQFVFAKNVEIDRVAQIGEHIELMSLGSQRSGLANQVKSMEKLIKKLDRAIGKAYTENEALEVTLIKYHKKIDEMQSFQKQRITNILKSEKKINKLLKTVSRRNPDITKEILTQELSNAIDPKVNAIAKENVLNDVREAGSQYKYLIEQKEKLVDELEQIKVSSISKIEKVKRVPAADTPYPTWIQLMGFFLVMFIILLIPSALLFIFVSATVGYIAGVATTAGFAAFILTI
jgi:hypothetical protein